MKVLKIHLALFLIMLPLYILSKSGSTYIETKTCYDICNSEQKSRMNSLLKTYPKDIERCRAPLQVCYKKSKNEDENKSCIAEYTKCTKKKTSMLKNNINISTKLHKTCSLKCVPKRMKKKLGPKCKSLCREDFTQCRLELKKMKANKNKIDKEYRLKRKKCSDEIKTCNLVCANDRSTTFPREEDDKEDQQD